MPQQFAIDDALARARKAAKNGHTRLARELFSAVLRQHPKHPVARKGLKRLQRACGSKGIFRGQIDTLIELYKSGQAETATQECRRLLRRDPTSVLVLNILGSSLQAQGRINCAISAFDRAIQLHPEFAEAYNNRGNAHKARGAIAAAVADYDKAVAIRPDYAEAWFNRANGLRDVGRFDEAIECYKFAIERMPGFVQAYRSLGALQTWQAGDPLLGALTALHDRLDDTDPGRAEACFALAKAKEDLDDLQSGFELLAQGNHLMKVSLGYSFEDDRALFDKIRTISADAASSGGSATKTYRPARPLFIVGMMRSGTSLVEQILASHSDVYGAGEVETLNRLAQPLVEAGRLPGPEDLNALRIAYLKSLEDLPIKVPVVTDKMPLNFRWVGLILGAFPDAKIVHVHRDPVATCWSIYKHFFPAEGHGYAWDLADIADYFGLYRELMAYWHEKFPGTIYDLRYETLTEHQESETRTLLDYCDLSWEPACLDFHRTKRAVATSSVAQVRKRMYQGSSGAWRRYEPALLGSESGRAFLERRLSDAQFRPGRSRDERVSYSASPSSSSHSSA